MSLHKRITLKTVICVWEYRHLQFSKGGRANVSGLWLTLFRPEEDSEGIFVVSSVIPPHYTNTLRETKHVPCGTAFCFKVYFQPHDY